MKRISLVLSIFLLTACGTASAPAATIEPTEAPVIQLTASPAPVTEPPSVETAVQFKQPTPILDAIDLGAFEGHIVSIQPNGGLKDLKMEDLDCQYAGNLYKAVGFTIGTTAQLFDSDADNNLDYTKLNGEDGVTTPWQGVEIISTTDYMSWMRIAVKSCSGGVAYEIEYVAPSPENIIEIINQPFNVNDQTFTWQGGCTNGSFDHVILTYVTGKNKNLSQIAFIDNDEGDVMRELLIKPDGEFTTSMGFRWENGETIHHYGHNLQFCADGRIADRRQ